MNKLDIFFQRKNFKNTIFIGFVFLLFFLVSYISLDPDFGWRLKAGAIYLGNGIPKTDPFTYTMPSFPWVDHAWLQTLFLAALFPIIGKFGLSIIDSGFSLAAVFISISRAKGVYIKQNITFKIPKIFFLVEIIPFILAVPVLLSFSGVRVQILTWVFLAILLSVVFDENLWKKFRNLTPLFFLIWTNLHGGFASGIASLFLIILVRSFRKKTIDYKDLAILVLSLFATVATPYGLGTWREVYSSVSDKSLRWSINEWMPSFFIADLSMGAYIVLSTTLIFRYRKLYLLEEKILFVVFLIQGLLTRRHLPLWIIMSLPLSIEGIFYLYKEILKIQSAKARFIKAYGIGLYGAYIIFLMQIAINFIGVYNLRESNFYPQNAVAFLKANLPKGEIFSDYGWGGYLIWRIPEKKVFIDGRMPSWKWSPPNNNETGNAFEDYKKILSGEIYFRKQFEKYDIDTVLLPRTQDVKLEGFLEKKLMNLLGLNYLEYKLTDDLEKANWIKLYEDKTAVIYKNP